MHSDAVFNYMVMHIYFSPGTPSLFSQQAGLCMGRELRLDSARDFFFFWWDLCFPFTEVL